MGKKNYREKDGVEEKRRSGRHDLDKDGEKLLGVNCMDNGLLEQLYLSMIRNVLMPVE